MWPSTHQSLLCAVRDPQDAAAWEEFAARYRAGLMTLFLREFGLRSDLAEEAAQLVMLKLFRALQQFRYDERQSFRGWLSTVARRTAIDMLRSEARRPDVGVGGSAIVDVLQNYPDFQKSLSDVLEAQLRRELLEQAESRVKARLAEDSTWQVYLAYKRGDPPAEIAGSLGMSVSAVYKAKSRVAEKLRREICRMTAVD